MERSEPALKPQWLKSSPSSSLYNGGTASNANEHSVGFLLRSKLTSTDDKERNSFSSCKRSSSLNVSRSHDKDSSGKSRAYSSFGKSNRSRERERDFDICDREIRLGVGENGFHERFGRSERDTMRRSQSMVTRKPLDRPEGLGVNPSNGFHPRGSIVGPSFEKDFPSLGADEKNGRLEVGRVSPPSINSPIQSIPIPSSAISGLESWNSVLVEAPTTVSNGSGLPCGAQYTVQVPAAPCSTTSLNMAETVAQAPARVLPPPQLSIDTTKNEESARKLIPLTPSSTKISVLSLSEKLKNKGTRGTDSSSVHKFGSQLLSQPVSAALRAPIRPDNSKPSQAGGFHILNRERNNISPSIKDSPSKPVTPVGISQSGSAMPLKSPTNQRPKGDGKGVTSSSQNPFGEKRLQSNAKDRNEFFNIIRNKASSCSSATPEPGDISSSSSLLDLEKQNNSPCEHMEDPILSNTDPRHLEDSVCATPSECPDACSDNEKLPPEEEAFLRSLGWDDNAEDQWITEEEIDDFNMKYKDLMLFSKFSQLRTLSSK